MRPNAVAIVSKWLWVVQSGFGYTQSSKSCPRCLKANGRASILSNPFESFQSKNTSKNTCTASRTNLKPLGRLGQCRAATECWTVAGPIAQCPLGHNYTIGVGVNLKTRAAHAAKYSNQHTVICHAFSESPKLIGHPRGG